MTLPSDDRSPNAPVRAKRGRSFLKRVLRAIALAGPRGKGKFTGQRIGRGAGAGSVLAARDRYAAFRQRRVIMRNPGGDALDAVIAAIGAGQAWDTADHEHIARHPRYRREGRLYV